MRGTRLARYVAAREALLERIVAALQSDERVVAGWLSGSFGRGEGDDWADYDLHVVVADEAMTSFLEDRRALYASLGSVALVQDEIPGQPRVGDEFHLVHFATPDGPIEVDWSFVASSEARKPIGHRLLFERREFAVMSPPLLTPEEHRAEARRWALFFWAMAPIAIRLCGRGDLERAIPQIRLLQRALICLWRLTEGGDVPAPWQPDVNTPTEV